MAAVAKAVGVSIATVSNAYNHPDQLSAELRERILAEAAAIGYAGPDPSARSLRTRQVDAVGLVFTARLDFAFSDPGAVEFLRGLSEACADRGKSLLLVAAVPGPGNPDTVARAAVDGFVVYSMPDGDPYLANVFARPQPVVIVDSPGGLTGIDFVGIDDREAFRGLADHLFALGHRRIGVVTVRRGEDTPAEPEPRALVDRLHTGGAPHRVRHERLSGLLEAAAHHAVTSGDLLVVERESADRENGALGAAAMLDLDEPPTAIMCTADEFAFGVLDELARRGMTPGVDLSVTGFDDVSGAAAVGLTTARQPIAQKGRAAIELLLDDRPRSRARKVVLPTELVIRQSTGAPQDD